MTTIIGGLTDFGISWAFSESSHSTKKGSILPCQGLQKSNFVRDRILSIRSDSLVEACQDR